MSELLLIISKFYTRREVALLLYPMIGLSLDFRSFVLQNYLKASNVDDLVQMSGMGRSNFDAKFNREFGMPPRQWMLKQIAKQVRHRASEPVVTIKQMINQFGFNSATHFNRFCRQQFDLTPGELIRQASAEFESITQDK